jgi:hypothetical protein
MYRALATVLIVALALVVVAPPAEACLECVALGLASFAVFTQLVTALTVPRVVYPYGPLYYGPYAYPAAPAPAYAPAPAARPTPVGWTGPRVVQYPHGRYELTGDGMSVAYAWVWIPSARAPVAPRPNGVDENGSQSHVLTVRSAAQP